MAHSQEADLELLAMRLGALLSKRGVVLATAESCTGGWVAQTITLVPGSSAWFERGFITYTNNAKQEMLGVRAATLETCGAVSEATAREMAEGALLHSHAQVSLAVSGIAGPA
ncbi:MAG: nicotinamide-nucleotide amidohydrolase family protein, partial [Gammaproteobacteria bacterium]